MPDGEQSNKSQQRMALAGFLWARRNEVQPEDVGLTRQARRRCPASAATRSPTSPRSA